VTRGAQYGVPVLRLLLTYEVDTLTEALLDSAPPFRATS
jgi:hypothetical protein